MSFVGDSETMKCKAEYKYKFNILEKAGFITKEQRIDHASLEELHIFYTKCVCEIQRS